MHEALELLSGIPPWLVYLALGVGAALENLMPLVPADTFVVVGGLLSSRDVMGPFTIWAVTWSTNVAGALAVYAMGWRHGRVFFEEGAGRWLLNRSQLDRVEAFYRRWGTVAVFLARFLPGLRAIVPAFAGIGHLGVTRTALSIAAASAIWYGALVGAGHLAGRNLERVEAWLLGTNRVLLGFALIIIAVIAVAWWRTRHEGSRER